MMKLALKEVHKVVNDPSVQTLPVSPDHFHAYVAVSYTHLTLPTKA